LPGQERRASDSKQSVDEKKESHKASKETEHVRKESKSSASVDIKNSGKVEKTKQPQPVSIAVLFPTAAPVAPAPANGICLFHFDLALLFSS